jgi:hypothetical protein
MTSGPHGGVDDLKARRSHRARRDRSDVALGGPLLVRLLCQLPQGPVNPHLDRTEWNLKEG